MSFSPPYTYITAQDLAARWKAQGAQPKPHGLAIVDVRDDDFEGGHIKGCWNVPSTQLGERLDEVVGKMREGGYESCVQRWRWQ